MGIPIKPITTFVSCWYYRSPWLIFHLISAMSFEKSMFYFTGYFKCPQVVACQTTNWFISYQWRCETLCCYIFISIDDPLERVKVNPIAQLYNIVRDVQSCSCASTWSKQMKQLWRIPLKNVLVNSQPLILWSIILAPIYLT